MNVKNVLFLPENKSVPMDGKSSILELALRNGIEIDHSCGGMGSCTTCRIFVENPVDNLPQRTELEAEVAKDRGFATNERLSCQLIIPQGQSSDWSVRVPSPRT